MDKEYSNRELDEKFNGIHEKLDLIIVQTTKTNGSVRGLQNWKAWMTGGMSVITFIVIPLLCWIFSTSLSSVYNSIKEVSYKLDAHQKETLKIIPK